MARITEVEAERLTEEFFGTRDEKRRCQQAGDVSNHTYYEGLESGLALALEILDINCYFYPHEDSYVVDVD